MVKDDKGTSDEAKVKVPPRAFEGRKSFIKKLYSPNTLVFVGLVVVIILVITWSSRENTVQKVMDGIFHRSVDKIDVCKGESNVAARNNCYRDLAFSTNNTYFCAKLFNNTRISESCYAKLAISANSKNACMQIKNEKTRGFCLSQLAINKEEIPLCNTIEDPDWKNYCYGQLAIVLKKPETCALIDNNSSSDCYLNVAENMTSGQTCAFIDSIAKRDQCYLAIGSVNFDFSLCHKIDDISKKFQCYHRIAKATGNSTLCNYIPKELNQNCFDAVNNKTKIIQENLTLN
jgi:hypothetical protein